MLAVQLQAPHLATRYALGFVEHGGRAALVAATGHHFASIASWQRVCRGSPWPNARGFSVMDPLPELVKELKIPVCGMGPVSEAISTVGGIDLGDLSDDFELVRMPGSFAIGEMLDYDAPTGGYLLQSCFSMGKYLAWVLNNRST
jgi:predicted flavoprotein YhiN